jgi:putative FmdB family regulatory protein
MPVYTYRCENCGVQFERHQSFNDLPLKSCPECRKKTLRKVIGPTRIIFKGSGFYATDHKSSSGAASAKPAGDDAKPKKEDAKPAKEDSKATTAKPESAG